jgi:hypothetical protein
VSSAVRTLRGNSRERREDNPEESEVIWKESLESKTHKDAPDYGDGGRSVREIAVTKLALPIEEEELEEANMRWCLKGPDGKPQEEGMMSTSISFLSVWNQGLIDQ